MKPFDLFISENHKQLIRDGAPFIAVEWVESDACCKGSVVGVGSEDECLALMSKVSVLVLTGFKPFSGVWSSSEVLPLIEQEAVQA